MFNIFFLNITNCHNLLFVIYNSINHNNNYGIYRLFFFFCVFNYFFIQEIGILKYCLLTLLEWQVCVTKTHGLHIKAHFHCQESLCSVDSPRQSNICHTLSYIIIYYNLSPKVFYFLP